MIMSAPNTTGQIEAPLSAPKYGTLIPNRIFVGGIRWAKILLLYYTFFLINTRLLQTLYLNNLLWEK